MTPREQGRPGRVPSSEDGLGEPLSGVGVKPHRPAAPLTEGRALTL